MKAEYRKRWSVLADEYPELARLLMRDIGVLGEEPKYNPDFELSSDASTVYDFINGSVDTASGGEIFNRFVDESDVGEASDLTGEQYFAECLDELVAKARLLRWPVEGEGFEYFSSDFLETYLHRLSDESRRISLDELYNICEESGTPVTFPLWKILHSDRYLLKLPEQV